MFNVCVLNHPHHVFHVMAPDLPELLVGRSVTLHGQTVSRQGAQFYLSHEGSSQHVSPPVVQPINTNCLN